MSTSPRSALSPTAAGRAPGRPNPDRSVGWWPAIQPMVWTLLVVLSAWVVGRSLRLDAASEPGYWIGVAGGVSMLALFLYPLRKRVPALRNFGATRRWFVFHMLMGVAGPWLILVHCNFRVGSLNAAVALFSMLIVAASGVVGRYLYGHVHRGLDGRHAELAELRARLDATHGKLAHSFERAPALRDRLFAFEQATLTSPRANALAQLIGSASAARAAHRDVRRLIEAALASAPPSIDAARRRQIRANWRRQAAAHIDQTLAVAQLRAWERLFSLWHVLHLPFVYVMVACAIAHVVAVHAY